MISLLGKLAAYARLHGLGGATARLRDAADRLFVALDWLPLAVTIDGVTIRGYLRHRSFLAELGRGRYEPYLRRLFLAAAADADVILDVGAHTGLYALLATRARPEGRIIAVEADPYNAAALTANVRAASAGVEVVTKAASDSIARTQFNQNLGTVGSSLVEREGTGPARIIEIEATTIDAVVGEPPPGALLLKLDVEGAERRVLAGARRTITGARSATLLVELNPKALAASDDSGPALISDLEQLGLRVEFVDEARAELVPPGAADRKGNLIARKP